MSEMDLLEAARPDVAPLTDDERQWLRSQIFQEGAAAAPTTSNSHAVSVVVETAGRQRRQSVRPTRVLTMAAAVIALVGLGGLWMAVRSDGPRDEPAASAPPATSVVSAAAPSWYQPIRSVLPDGFDQIVLTDASTQSLSFKAFRTGTRQMLDVVITWPGTDLKDTSDLVTFTDYHGDYYESVSGVTLITTDQRIVNVRCGLSPIGGGAVGSASMADSRRDYCGPGFDNRDLDPASRRELAVRLSEAFPSEASIAEFAQPTPPPSEFPELLQQLAEFVGVAVEIGGEQDGGVLRTVNLSNPASTLDTELTIIHGIWPPQAADPANPWATGASRFVHSDDLAVALVVTADGTGYHMLTTNLTDDHLAQLGTLLDTLANTDDQPTTDSSVTATIPVTTPASTLPSPSIAVTPACATGTYLLVEGDTPLAVATKFDLTLDEFTVANADTEGFQAFAAGTTVTIPPAAVNGCGASIVVHIDPRATPDQQQHVRTALDELGAPFDPDLTRSLTGPQGAISLLLYTDQIFETPAAEQARLETIATALKTLPMVVEVDVLGIPVP